MARKLSIPDSILQYVPCKCSRIRNDGDVYRVYKYSAIKLPSGKWSSNYGYLIGKILPEKGFFPNKRYLKELATQGNVSFSDEITDVAYGQYALLMFLSQDILNYIKNDAGFNNLKIQDYYVEHGFDFIMLVTGLIHSRLDKAVKSIRNSSLSTFDFLVKAGHMRMVLDGDEWKLHNTRTKDLELIAKTGFKPIVTYLISDVKA